MTTRKRIRAPGVDLAIGDQDRDKQAPVHEDSQEQPEEVTDPQQLDNNTNGAYVMKRRGITTGISVEKKRRKKEKLKVIVHSRRRRIVGQNAKDFKTEACCVLKGHAPLQCRYWKDIPVETKKKMWLAMKQKFDLQEDFSVREIVFEQLNRQYLNRRHKLHGYYLCHKDDEDIMHHPPEGVVPQDWEYLINFFETDEFKKVSDRNKKNRKKLKMSHACGTKSIAQYCHEERDPITEEEPTRTATWKKTRQSRKKKGWVDPASEKAYEDLTRLQSQPVEEGLDPMNEDEAFIEVFGQEKPSRLRGCGDGLKPPSKRGQRINHELEKENEELRKQAEKDRESIESLKTENKEMTLRLESVESQVNNQETLVQAQVQALLKTQIPAIIQNLAIVGQTHPPPPNV